MLKDFTVIEIVKQVASLTLIIEPNKLRQTRGIVEALEYAPMVRYLLDRNGRRLAIQVAGPKDKQALKFSQPADEQGARAVLTQNADLLGMIRGMMPEWDPEKKYRVEGSYSKNEKAVIFELENAKPYARHSRGDSSDAPNGTENIEG